MTMHMIERVLIANRGEIAVRIMRTCRAMGIRTVAVFSDADERAPFVRQADEAVRLGPPPAAESYLAIDKILAAARATGADAIHPGYGFLAENGDFAEACAAAGVIFIGPSPAAIRTLGSKRASKRLVAQAGVPVIPGWSGDDQSVVSLCTHAEEVGFPLLLKASAGGGGKGMRIVREAARLEAAIESAKREAASAFGDDTMLLERYIERPRHVEMQILGDHHGNLVHLFERECSIQRRHQKIIEESPSPALDETLRARMGEAAVAVGRAVDYHNAGTVEFILAPSGDFYFLEVNTRLQVEHPVTECVTGIDLVRAQLQVARGERLPFAQTDLHQRGAAIECRLYAEDPDHEFLPGTGRIVDWHAPEVPGLRIDTGVESGQEVSIHYDPMLAKVICQGETRAEAIARMIYSLEGLSVAGVVTNRDYLLRVLRHPAFRSGEIDTHFIDSHADALRPAANPDARIEAAIAVTLFDHQQRRQARAVLPHLEPGFRNNRGGDEWVRYRAGDDELEIRYRNQGGGRFRCTAGEVSRTVCVADVSTHAISIEHDGRLRQHRIARDGLRWHSLSGGTAVVLVEEPRFPEPGSAAIQGACVAPMPGKVVKVLVSIGQAVSAGDTLMVLEAMKMEHSISAPEDGVVVELAVAEGDQVEAEVTLIVVGPADV
ncbi:MAG TPA: acetyl-CoA carboxylase biotin carboxylase subunit [Kofleriaceae bacterium]|nr:acetyl-CoA carboxylase biotin carboxylase subunit [Kofleriaceae bacterium]